MASKLFEYGLSDSDDPTVLVPGDVIKLLNTRDICLNLGKGYTNATEGTRFLTSGEHWHGKAADSFDGYVGDLPSKIDKLGQAFSMCVNPLTHYVEMLQWGRGQAVECVAQWQRGKALTDQATEKANANNGILDSQKDVTGDNDPGLALKQGADKWLDDVRHKVDQAAIDAQKAVDTARELLPRALRGVAQWQAKTQDMASTAVTWQVKINEGVLNGAEGLVSSVRSVVPFDIYNITHPTDYAKNVKGLVSGLWTVGSSTLTGNFTPLKEMGKSLVAWDKWNDDPGAALGETGFNIVSTFATGGEGGVAKVGSTILKVGMEDGVRAGLVAGGKEAAALVAARAKAAMETLTKAQKLLSGGAGKIADQISAMLAKNKAELVPAGVDGGIPWAGNRWTLPPTVHNPGSFETGMSSAMERHPYDPYAYNPGRDVPRQPATPRAGRPRQTPPPNVGRIDTASAHALEAAGGGLSKVERDLSGIKVHEPAPVPERELVPTGPKGAEPPKIGSAGGDSAAAKALQSAGGDLSKIEKEIDAIKVRDASPLTHDQVLAKEAVDNLLDIEKMSLRDYMGAAYREINDHLRLGTILTYPEHIIPNMVSALKKLPDYVGKVERGINVDVSEIPGILDRYAPGQNVVEKAFTSTSKKRAKGYPNVKFIIESTKGKDISWLKNATGKGEGEVLYPPNSEFTVTEREIDSEGNVTIYMNG
jgi:hypothetical protein